MTGKSRSIAAFALIFAVFAACFFVPVRRTSSHEFAGPDGSRQRVRSFGTINITLEEYLRTRGARVDAAGSETRTVLRAGAYAQRIGGILLGGGALVGLSAFASRRKKKIRDGR